MSLVLSTCVLIAVPFSHLFMIPNTMHFQCKIIPFEVINFMMDANNNGVTSERVSIIATREHKGGEGGGGQE